jgi:hypothetical protein
MKKDRNTFFNESSYMNQTSYPQMGMNIANQPFQTTGYVSQGFYAGSPLTTPQNYTTQTPQSTNYINYDYSDIESRLSKIERQINRIDARLNKLENTSFYSTEDTDTTNNIYMV